jgi:hypothetical protein
MVLLNISSFGIRTTLFSGNGEIFLLRFSYELSGDEKRKAKRRVN